MEFEKSELGDIYYFMSGTTEKFKTAEDMSAFTSAFPSAFSRRAVFSYWRKYVHEVLVNRLGGLSLPRKSVVRLTDRPDMTLDIYRGRKTTIQQQHFSITQHFGRMYSEILDKVEKT